MRSLSRVTVVLLTCLFSAIGTLAGGDLASGAPSGAQLHLTGISPTAGPLEGGNEVTIRADGAAEVTSVDFGAASGGRITHISAHLLRVVAPAHDAGHVDVVLHSASATSPVSPVGGYRFVAKPNPLQLQWSQRLGSSVGVGHLDAIGCTVHGFCAVEMRNSAGHVTALATFGNGHRPRVQPLPDKPVISRFICDGYCPVWVSQIACGTPKFCLAGTGHYLRVWNGHRWHRPTQLDRAGDRVISCAPGTMRCVLGGRHDSLVHGRHGWRTVPFPHGFHPRSLACATTRLCLATAAHGATARFDGTSWHDASRLHFQAVIGCASAHYCLAVGARNAAVFDGTAWRAVAAPAVRSARTDVQAVSCIAVGRCAAATKRFAETFAHGRWTKTQAISGRREFAPSAPLEVTGFACVPHGICRATTGRGQTLRLAHAHWDGTENITAYHDKLNEMSCASPTWCMAVTRSGEAFRYSGGQWTPEGHVDGRNPLVAISCTTVRACVAVDAATGMKQAGIFSGGRAVRYAHGSWHHPVVIDTGHQLTDVSCASAEHCVAVDRDGRAITYRHKTWSDPTSLNQRKDENDLRFTDSVDCPTTHYCATAGYPSSQELIDGTWRKIDSHQPGIPQYGAPTEDASGVDCLDASYCVFTDLFGVVIRNHGVVGWGYAGCCTGRQAVSCASRIYCAATYNDEGRDFNYTHTYLLAGAAVRRERTLSVQGRIPAGIACFAGPVCVGVTNTHGFVGT